MEYEEYAPPDDLKSLVRCFWTLRSPAGDFAPEPALPDGCPELIINLGDPFMASRGREPEVQPVAMLVGQITRPFSVAPSGAIALLAARLTPFGGCQLFRPMHQITDAWHELDSTSLHTFAERHRASPPADVLAELTAQLRVLAGRARGADARVVAAVTRIEESHGTADVGDVARDAGTSPRNLQRLFGADVGISPKLLSRIRRFQRVFAARRDDPGSWAAVAHACGYFDQAHLVRDFSELGGAAPVGLVAGMSAFTRQFTALGGTSTAS